MTDHSPSTHSPSTLASTAVTDVLDRLYAAADGDGPALGAFLASTAGADPHDLPPRESADLAAELYLPVAREVGAFLYQLARATRPALIVEFGTSFGVSALHLAAAARDNGVGRVVTTELSRPKVHAARANLAAAGLADLVEVHEGDAHETLRNLGQPIDLLLLDGWNNLYFSLLPLLEPHLRPGSLVIADDVIRFASQSAEYLNHVRDPKHGYASTLLPLDDGLEISVRL